MIKAKQFNDAEALAQATVELLANQLLFKSAQAIMLAGGSTPMEAYRRLAALKPRPAGDLHLFFSDDRHVPPDSPKSNYGNTRHLFNALGLGPEQIIRVYGEQPLTQAVEHYDRDLAALVEQGPRFSLGLLGLGADGHTASLFTPAHVAQGRGRSAIGVDRPDGMQGVSVTSDFLLRIERLVFLVSGADKKPMTDALLRNTLSITAGLATAQHPNVELWMDKAAWPL